MTHRRLLALGLILGATAAATMTESAPVRAADLLTGGIALAPSATAAANGGTAGARREAPVSMETLFFGVAPRDQSARDGGANASAAERVFGLGRATQTADIFGLTRPADDADARDPRR